MKSGWLAAWDGSQHRIIKDGEIAFEGMTVKEDLSQAIIHAAERVWGEPPVVAGVSTQGIIMIHVPHPAVLSGFGAPDNNLHAPNENMPVDRYLQGIKFAATIFQEFADRTQ